MYLNHDIMKYFFLDLNQTWRLRIDKRHLYFAQIFQMSKPNSSWVKNFLTSSLFKWFFSIASRSRPICLHSFLWSLKLFLWQTASQYWAPRQRPHRSSLRPLVAEQEKHFFNSRFFMSIVLLNPFRDKKYLHVFRFKMLL